MKKQLTFIVSAMLTSFEKVQIMKKIIFLIAIAFISLTTSAQNLLTNPSFETWSAGVPAGWTLTTTAGGTVSQSTKTINGLGSAFQIASPTGTYTIQQNVLPPAGATYFDTNITYKLSVNYLATAGDGTDARVWSGFITSAAGVTPIVYYSYPTNHADSLLYYIPIHGPGGSLIPPAGVVGNDANGFLLDNRSSGIWHTYTCNVKFPANITQFNFAVRTYSTSTVIWDNLFFGDAATDIQSPTVPEVLTNSTPTESSFTLSWNPSTDNIGIAGYDVYKDNVFYASTTSTSLDITGLAADKSYLMTVRAKDAAGNISNESTALAVKTLPIYEITVQIGLNGVVTENDVTLSNGSIIKVVSGGKKTFTITPNTGYEISTITYRGINVKSQIINNQYTTSIVSSNSILDVSFGLILPPGYKNINVPIAGRLSLLLTATEKTTITNLTVTGSINAYDVKTMRDNMPLLAVLDISAVSIQTCTGAILQTYSTTYPANEMPENSFCNSNNYPTVSKTTLKTIVLPASITSIGSRAFYGCRGITGSLNLPSTLTNIGNSAFYGCSGISGVIPLPNTLTTIGSSAFDGCTGITEFIVPETNQNLSSLNGVVFNKSQTTLTLYPPGKKGAYTIPNNVDIIITDAFRSCSGITTITLPNSLHTIENFTFSGCGGITDFIVSETNQYFSSQNGVLFNKPQTSLMLYPRGKRGAYVVPSSVDSICTEAFAGCSVSNLTLPNSLTRIGNRAFSYCGFLKTTLVLPNSLTSIGTYAFSDCSGINSLIIPSNLNTIGEYAFNNCFGIKSIYSLNRTPPALEFGCFGGLVSVTDVFVPTDEAVTDYKASEWYSYFTDNKIKKGTHLINVPTAGSLSTLVSTDLSTVINLTLSGNIDARDVKCMRDQMPNLRTLDLSACTINEYIGTEGTYNTASTTYPAKEMPQWSFYSITNKGKTSLKSIILPTNLNSIGSGAFTSCFGLSGSIDLPTTLTSIGSYAFAFCHFISGIVTISNTITNIGSAAFSGCSITEFNVAETNQYFSSINGILFNKNQSTIIQCPDIIQGSYIIPNSVTSIDEGAFFSCLGITEITIPSGLNSIGSGAFQNCSGIKSIFCLNPTPPTLGTSAFTGATSVTDVFVPTDAAVTAYKASSWFTYFPGTIIKSGAPNAVADLSINSIKVYATAGGISIEGLAVGEKVTLYTTNGIQLRTLKSDGSRIVLPALPNGVYLVKTSGKTFKVMM